MKKEHAEDLLANLRAMFGTLFRERDELIERLNNPPRGDEGKCAEVLRKALNAETGWREQARAALGLERMIACEKCGSPFPSGGKRKLNCGKC